MKSEMMIRRWRIRITLIGVLALMAGGCHSIRRGEPVGRVPEMRSSAIEHGQIVFQQRCYRCHPGGEGGLGPSLNDKPAPVFLMKTQVRRGLGAMPRFTKQEISPEDLDDLMNYVIALRKAPRQKSADAK